MDDNHRIAIEHDCAKLVLTFARLNDEWDNDGLANLMAEDGIFARPLDPENPFVGREAVREGFRSRPKRLSRHIMTNIEVNVISETEAEGHSYVLFLSTTDHDAPRPVTAEPGIHVGAYHDKFVLTEEGWRFAERRGSMALKTA